MLETKTDGPRALAFVLSEANGHYSREVVTIAEGGNTAGDGKLEAGTVLGTITATGFYIASPNAEVVDFEGAETASAILAYPVDASDGDVEAVVIARAAEVKAPMLIHDASVDNDTKLTAKATQLAAAGIIVR